MILCYFYACFDKNRRFQAVNLSLMLIWSFLSVLLIFRHNLMIFCPFFVLLL